MTAAPEVLGQSAGYQSAGDQSAARGSDASGKKRRSLRLAHQLDSAHQCQAQVLLTGVGVHDLLVTGRGEARRLLPFLHGYCSDRRIGLVFYSMAEGIRSCQTLDSDRAVSVRLAAADEHPAQAISQLLVDLRASATPAMLVFDYADGVLGENLRDLETSLLCESLQALTADARWHQLGLRLVVVDRGAGISSRLADLPGMQTIQLGPPDPEELAIFAARTTQATATARLRLDAGLSAAEVGRRASGLLNLHVHGMRLASTEQAPVTAQQIAAAKAAAIRDISGGALELMSAEATFSDDVAGLLAVRLALEDAQRAGRTTLRILLAGPPGTGKTLAASAIGRFLNVPVVRYGEILNEFVGVAERNMARANHVLRAMAPLVLFIDEADQVGLGARGTSSYSSEVHQNLRAALFEFLGDTAQQNGISVVATTNVPDRLDDAALSRFTVIPVLFGSAEEVVQIMTIHAPRLGIPIEGDLTPVLSAFIAAGNVLSGRSAVRLLELAHSVALRSGETSVSPARLREAIAGWIGSDWNLISEHSTLSALLAARHIDSWPWVAAAELGVPYQAPAYLQPYLIEPRQVDVAAMRERLAELSGSLAVRHE